MKTNFAQYKNFVWLKVDSIAEVFYGANYWSPIITSKNSSETLSIHNKHLCLCTVFSSFCCLQDKTWIKMPKWTIFSISSEEIVLIAENFWRIFWRDNWRSIISAVENFRYRVRKSLKLCWRNNWMISSSNYCSF